MSSRKARIDSATEAVRVMASAANDIDPPAHVPLEPDDVPFFRNVIAEFAKSEWTPHQIDTAALLARLMSGMEREQRLLREEGSVMFTEKGTPVVNPRKTVVQMYAGTILSARRSLQIHGRGLNGETRDAAKRNSAAQGIEADSPFDDDLIARPV